MSKTPKTRTEDETFRRLADFLARLYTESDRGAALMAASMLDEVLRETLAAFLVDCSETTELLNGYSAPLGTFSSRIKMAYALGLIDRQELVELEAIRTIRNAFGHSWEDIRFDSPKIAAQIEKLPFPKQPPRNRLNNTVANLFGDLLWRDHLARKIKCATRTWPARAGFGRHHD